MVCKKWECATWVEKSKVVAVGCEDVNAAIGLNNQTLKEIESFTYVGSSIEKSGQANTEVDSWIEKGAEHTYQMW